MLAAEASLDLTRPFGVSNADDLYGRDAFVQLGQHLAASPNNCLIGFELDRALVGELPVSRGTCHVVNGHLTEIVERRNVRATLEGYVAEDGLEPVGLHPRDDGLDEPVGLPALDPAPDARADRASTTSREDSEIQLLDLRRLDPAPHVDALRRAAHDGRAASASPTPRTCPLAQMLVRLEIESGDRPEYAFA